MKDWLLKRLTPRKKQESRWTGLSSGLQEVWEEHFDPSLMRLENMRSYFRADETDLAAKLREMGDYFSLDMPRPGDKPIAVAWRRLELEYKDLELILTSVFRRHFGNLPTAWFPIFAPLDEEYGMTFVAAEGPWPVLKNIPPEGMWLTSRGMLGSDLGHLLQYGYSKKSFLEKAVPLLMRTKPLHIVYDGPLFYIRFDIPVEFDFSVYWERDLWCDIPFRMPVPRYDYIPADARQTDLLSTMYWWSERDNFTSMPFMGNEYQQAWHLDWRVPAGFPDGWLPEGMLLGGIEGERVAPFRIYLQEVSQRYSMEIAPASLQSRTESDVHTVVPHGIPGIHTSGSTESSLELLFFPEKLWHLDIRLSTPEGWLPQDFALPGVEGEAVPRLSLCHRDRECPVGMWADMWLESAVEKSVEPGPIAIAPPAVALTTDSTFLHGIAYDSPLRTTERELESFFPIALSAPMLWGSESGHAVSTPWGADISTHIESTTPMTVQYGECRDRLDRWACFDSVPADFCPLDMPIGGMYA